MRKGLGRPRDVQIRSKRRNPKKTLEVFAERQYPENMDRVMTHGAFSSLRNARLRAASVGRLAFAQLQICCVLVCFIGLPLAPALADEAVLVPFEGEWRLDPSEGAKEARRDAIDEAVASLTWVMRMFAAPILHRDTAPPEQLHFYPQGDGWFQRAVAKETERVQPIELDAEPHKHVDPQGGDFQAIWKATEAGVELLWEQAQAVGSNRYHLDPKTGQLVLQQTIQVTEISGLEPIVLESRFDRADPPQLVVDAPSGG